QFIQMMRMMRINRYAIAVVGFLLISGLPLQAQITDATGEQAAPIPRAGHDYIHGPSEIVNPAIGGVSFRIDTQMPPGREITVPFGFGYDSNGAQHVSVVNNAPAWTD